MVLVKAVAAALAGGICHWATRGDLPVSATSAYVSPYAVNPSNSQVYMDFAVDSSSFFGMSKQQLLGRVEYELFDDTVPITARNFRELCRGGSGSTHNGQQLSFKGCVFHRIIPQFMIQGGDITRGNGTGGCSIYGMRFKDESFDGKAGKHKAEGLLSMANAGRNTNGSQFFVCTVACPWLDGKHVVFGQVVKGYEVIKEVELCGSAHGTPSKRIIVGECGVTKEL